jgi:hypothetical protein
MRFAFATTPPPIQWILFFGWFVFSIRRRETSPLLIIYQRNKATFASMHQRLLRIASWLRTMPQAEQQKILSYC